MKIYQLKNEFITQVQGEYQVVTQDKDFVYIESKTILKAPFKESVLPQDFILKQAKAFKKVQEEKINELNDSCEKSITSFQSNALGEMYIYDGKLEDQINLLGLFNANIDGFFRCAPQNQPELKQNLAHTKEQIKKVYFDGLMIKSKAIYQCGLLKQKVLEARNEDEINSIIWGNFNEEEKIENAV